MNGQVLCLTRLSDIGQERNMGNAGTNRGFLTFLNSTYMFLKSSNWKSKNIVLF